MDKTTPSPLNSSSKRVYSKAGCHTCKIRRLKCDQGRPGCRRCLSTGRVCDGYGVWGGGTGMSALMPNTFQTAPNLYDMSTRRRLGPSNHLERAGFDWFRNRAAVKLCGLFESRFWDTLVLQACTTAPAVLHAMLALSSAHKAEMTEGSRPEREQHERFTLEQYNKAIGCLRPHFTQTDRDGESARVVLITCVVFVCLELLRGRYVEGQTHLHSGLNLLSQLQAKLHTPGTQGVLVLGHPQESVSDSYLLEAYSRLYAQSSLFGQVLGAFRKPYTIATVIPDATFQAPPPIFNSMNQARQQLDGLFNTIHCLTVRFPRKTVVWDVPQALLDGQSRIQTCLQLWRQAYKVSRLTLTSQLNLRDALSYPLLMIYHTMAVVVAATCLTRDESIFDSFEAAFASVVSTCEEILKAAFQVMVADTAAGYCSEEFSFTADIGLIAPLYYAALKCRVPSIRRRAIKMLEIATHKEMIWNGAIAAQVAREVVKLEEQGLWSDLSCVDMSPDSFYHDAGDAQLASLRVPEWHRVHEVVLNLLDGLPGKAVLTCERRRENGEWELLEKQMDVCFAS
ncbi:hypothetical protein BGZ61DRAFT_364371 [Ilyonectria robusta]|uniref:uncharacterized protein n=1 Tax=Ilyonectria robusta TaxID=1079257 RepID=UPI001E8CC5F2|nr:uncharacterized protein BGZ61DRAFT_364371 [Ilyonectria robusta]KAH8669409.1 hypothetical protein BGZ61DRAFT_364371 [Ilyonectria robusta]